MKLVKNGSSIDDIDKKKPCINCGKQNSFNDSICGECAASIPDHIPEEQYKAYFLVKRIKNNGINRKRW